MNWWRRLRRAACLWSVCALSVCAQMAGPMRYEDFRVPDYDANGKLKSQVLGEVAELRPDGKIEITNLKIELYNEKKEVQGTVWAAKCLFDRQTRSAVSDTAVRLTQGKMVLTGTGLRWDAVNQRLEILHDVRVVLTDVRVWAKQEMH
jgi:hypothetical protein